MADAVKSSTDILVTEKVQKIQDEIQTETLGTTSGKRPQILPKTNEKDPEILSGNSRKYRDSRPNRRIPWGIGKRNHEFRRTMPRRDREVS